LFFWLNCEHKVGTPYLIFSDKGLLKLPVYHNIFDNLERRMASLILLILFSLPLSSQQPPKIDSLRLIVQNSKGADKCDALVKLARAYASFDNAKAVEPANEARAVAIQIGDSSRMVTTMRIVGQLMNRLDRSIEAEEALLEALPIAKRNNIRDEYKNILNNLAVAYTHQAKYDKALDMNFQTLLLREQDKDMDEINVSLNNIGLVYFKLKDFPKALQYYLRALQLLEKAENKYFLDRLFVNIGLCYNQLEQFEEAKKYFDRALETCGGNCTNQIMIEGKFGLGTSFYNRGNFVEALDNFNQSYLTAQKIGNKRFEAENLMYIGRIHFRQGDNNLAIDALKKCEDISRTLGYNEVLIDSYRELSLLYNHQKDHEKAAYYQGQYITIKDSIYSGDLIKNLATIQTKFEERENLAIIAARNETIERQRSLNVAIVIIAVLAALLVFVLLRSNQVKKKVNQALSDAKAIIEDQNKQLLSSNYSLDKELKEKNVDLEKANESLHRVNEELDNFIYKTSHDIRGPLASLKGMCNVALMDVKDSLALNYLKKLDITAEKLNTILTRLLIVNQINNSTLAAEKIDFDSIVGDVLMLEKKKGLPPRLKISKQISESIEYYSDKEFVRIILENLIDNAIKFYNDSERIEPFVDISVTEEGENVKIKVADNGIGISQVHPDKIFQMFSRASERSETGGIGLYITKTATEKLGGAVHLNTSPEGYTEFFVLLPMSVNKVMA
jgi:signal transduction histidine kinase/Tfp pilus assembly protein PilF